MFLRNQQAPSSDTKSDVSAQLLSRAKPAQDPNDKAARDASLASRKKQVPELKDFLDRRDYIGAITLLEFNKSAGQPLEDSEMWLGFCFCHLGESRKALEVYTALSQEPGCDPNCFTYMAVCYFMLGMYKEADATAKRGPDSPLQNRLLFHLSHKFGDESQLMAYHQNLQDVIEDQLTLASIHYVSRTNKLRFSLHPSLRFLAVMLLTSAPMQMRSHYQEAIDIYKRILLEHREYLALNVYIVSNSYPRTQLPAHDQNFF